MHQTQLQMLAMEECASRMRFTGEEDVQLLDLEGEDDGLEDTFFLEAMKSCGCHRKKVTVKTMMYRGTIIHNT